MGHSEGYGTISPSAGGDDPAPPCVGRLGCSCREHAASGGRAGPGSAGGGRRGRRPDCPRAGDQPPYRTAMVTAFCGPRPDGPDRDSAGAGPQKADSRRHDPGNRRGHLADHAPGGRPLELSHHGPRAGRESGHGVADLGRPRARAPSRADL